MSEHVSTHIPPPDRPLIMGILNVTPDSFSDGGRFVDVDAAVAHGLRMAREGADVIDVGGESTRPGAQRVNVDEQIRRTQPVIAALRRELDAHGIAHVTLSIDSTRAEVAQAAVEAGAAFLNDVSAGRESPELLTLAADRSLPIALMHMRGEPATMQNDPVYEDVVGEVEAFLLDRAAQAEEAGVARELIWLDPGIGFGKTRDHNLALLAALPRLAGHGYPILLGTSRKRFMGAICTPPGGSPPPPEQLNGATCATTALGVAAGVRMFRVHDVTANRQAADVAWAVCGGLSSR